MQIEFNEEVSTCVQGALWIVFISVLMYFLYSVLAMPSADEIMADKGFAKVYLTDAGDSSRPYWMLTNSTEYSQAIQKKLNLTAESANTGF